MMEVVDELMTPGCPNCALKHLSAAIERSVDGLEAETTEIDAVVTLLARAYINFTEAEEGYTSHRYYAIGLLVAAEERLIRNGNPAYANVIRGIRTGIMDGTGSLGALFCECVHRVAVAHVHEAFRELPELSFKFNRHDYRGCTQGTIDWLMEMIRWVEENYFGTNNHEEKGEKTTMATKKNVKVPAKKADTKAAKAACKGSKCSAKKSCKK